MNKRRRAKSFECEAKEFMRENANGFKKISLENEPSRNLNMNDGKADGVKRRKKTPLKPSLDVNYATVPLKCIKPAVCGAFTLSENQRSFFPPQSALFVLPLQQLN